MIFGSSSKLQSGLCYKSPTVARVRICARACVGVCAYVGNIQEHSGQRGYGEKHADPNLRYITAIIPPQSFNKSAISSSKKISLSVFQFFTHGGGEKRRFRTATPISNKKGLDPFWNCHFAQTNARPHRRHHRRPPLSLPAARNPRSRPMRKGLVFARRKSNETSRKILWKSLFLAFFYIYYDYFYYYFWLIFFKFFLTTRTARTTLGGLPIPITRQREIHGRTKLIWPNPTWWNWKISKERFGKLWPWKCCGESRATPSSSTISFAKATRGYTFLLTALRDQHFYICTEPINGDNVGRTLQWSSLRTMSTKNTQNWSVWLPESPLGLEKKTRFPKNKWDQWLPIKCQTSE